MTEDTKTCPDCAEEVKAAARVCRFCGYRFAGDQHRLPADEADLPAAHEPAAFAKTESPLAPSPPDEPRTQSGPILSRRRVLRVVLLIAVLVAIAIAVAATRLDSGSTIASSPTTVGLLPTSTPRSYLLRLHMALLFAGTRIICVVMTTTGVSTNRQGVVTGRGVMASCALRPWERRVP